MIDIEHAEGGEVLVVFSLRGDLANGLVSVVGDFNDWDPTVSPMTARLDDPSVIEATVRCETGRRYEFRYLSDAIGWFDEENAHELCANPHSGCNSVIRVPTAPEGDVAVVDLTESASATISGS